MNWTASYGFMTSRWGRFRCTPDTVLHVSRGNMASLFLSTARVATKFSQVTGKRIFSIFAISGGQGRLLNLVEHFAGSLMGNGNPALVGQVPAMLRRYRARVTPPLQVRFRNSMVKNNGNALKGILALNGQTRRLHEIRVMFLPQLLKWDDRNSMAFSIESRYPFLDHELIELCLSFAPQALYRQGWTKYPLRLGLKDHLPTKIRDRRSKFGFETPQDKWLCGALRPSSRAGSEASDRSGIMWNERMFDAWQRDLAASRKTR